jgi:flavin-dependent dehydrogenase
MGCARQAYDIVIVGGGPAGLAAEHFLSSSCAAEE